VTLPGIDSGTVQLVAHRLNYYATPGPTCVYVRQENDSLNSGTIGMLHLGRNLLTRWWDLFLPSSGRGIQHSTLRMETVVTSKIWVHFYHSTDAVSQKILISTVTAMGNLNSTKRCCFDGTDVAALTDCIDVGLKEN